MESFWPSKWHRLPGITSSNDSATSARQRSKSSYWLHDPDATLLSRQKNSIDPPSDWSANIVSSKSHEISPNSEGLRLFEEAQAVFSGIFPRPNEDNSNTQEERYGNARLVSPRLGQGGFRIMVMDEYSRRCAITGERHFPSLRRLT